VHHPLGEHFRVDVRRASCVVSREDRWSVFV
jgi:hypothetical protein